MFYVLESIQIIRIVPCGVVAGSGKQQRSELTESASLDRKAKESSFGSKRNLVSLWCILNKVNLSFNFF